MAKWIVQALLLGSLAFTPASALGQGVPAAATRRAGVDEPSLGDARVLALMARQSIESRDVVERGSTLVKLCTIRTHDGRASYTLYWFLHLTQAAVQVHGRSEVVVVSALGNVLGVYGYDGEPPRCSGGKTYPVVSEFFHEDPANYVTTFPPHRLPRWLGAGEEFSPAPRYESTRVVDGVGLPNLAR